MADKYGLCEAVISGPFPEWKTCGVKINRPDTRCEKHPAKKIWPGEDVRDDIRDNLIIFGVDGPRREP